MAFLCPVRIRRPKKKKRLAEDDDRLAGFTGFSRDKLDISAGHNNDSSFIEPQVHISEVEKVEELCAMAKMVVLHDFVPCVDDELEVKRGQVVHVLYRENDWIYVISDENRDGFVPFSYCTHFGSQLAEQALNVGEKLQGGGVIDYYGVSGSLSDSVNTAPLNCSPTTSVTARAIKSPTKFEPADHTERLEAASGGACASSLMTLGGSHALLSSAVTSNFANNTRRHQQHLLSKDTQSFHKTQWQLPPSDGPGQPRPRSLVSESSSQSDVQPFYRKSSGRYIALFSYVARDEHDLSVERGQHITLLNSDDPDWSWVSRQDKCEGFVPSSFIYPLDGVKNHRHFSQRNSRQKEDIKSGSQEDPQGQQELRPPVGQQRHYRRLKSPLGHPDVGAPGKPSASTSCLAPLDSAGASSKSSSFTSAGNFSKLALLDANIDVTAHPNIPLNTTQYHPDSGFVRLQEYEMVVLYDYKAQAPDDLSVQRGDWVSADLSNQTMDGWMWCRSPKSGEYGFIPKAFARPPAMTIL